MFCFHLNSCAFHSEFGELIDLAILFNCDKICNTHVCKTAIIAIESLHAEIAKHNMSPAD